MVSAIKGNAGLSSEELLMKLRLEQNQKAQAPVPQNAEKADKVNKDNNEKSGGNGVNGVKNAGNAAEDEFVRNRPTVRSMLSAPTVKSEVNGEFIKSAESADNEKSGSKYKIVYKKDENGIASSDLESKNKPVNEEVKAEENKQKKQDKSDSAKDTEKAKEDEDSKKAKKKKIIGAATTVKKMCPSDCPPDCTKPEHRKITSQTPIYGYE